MDLHNIHMNQGGFAPWDAENGRAQDGSLGFQIPGLGSVNEWTSIYISFQAQTWDIDGQGDPARRRAASLSDQVPPPVAGGGLGTTGRSQWPNSPREIARSRTHVVRRA